jgi:hypothetical protein
MARTLIAIVTCPRYLDRRNAVRDTWMGWVAKLNHDVDVKFFSGSAPCPVDDACEDIIHLKCPDDYDHLPKKTFAIVNYALENGYEHLIKVDDDTYLMPLSDYIAELTKVDCLGSLRTNPSWNQGIHYCQGGCYSLSRKAMQAVVSNPSLFAVGLEDGAVGKALHSGGIYRTDSSRIFTDYRNGHPRFDNDIISAHGCQPACMHVINNGVLLRLLSAYNEVVTSATVPKPELRPVTAKTIGIGHYIHKDKVSDPNAITLAVTSCSRPDLLRRTLESFAKCADLPIYETIIIEDSADKKPKWLDSVKGLGNITWLSNGRRCGQTISIDRLYDHIRTDLVFHCEEDWLFNESGFLQKSLTILNQHPEIWTVSLRGTNCNGHPNVKDNRFNFAIQEPYWKGYWGGCTWNPGLRRISDFQGIGSYGKVMGYGHGGIIPEQSLSKSHLDLGYRIAVLDKEYVTHIGAGRSQAIQPIPPQPKCLIAIPACLKYEYGSHANDLKMPRKTDGRIAAQRETWIKDIAPFSSYVDFKYFYGNPTRNGNVGGEWESKERAKPTSKGDEIVLDCPDDYEGLPHKIQAIYKYALDNGYDYVLKVDDDTWVYVDRMMRCGFENYDQMGYGNCTHKSTSCRCYITGGAGYWISQKAMRMVVNAPVTSWAEDLWVGSVLRKDPSIKKQQHNGFLPGFGDHYVTLPLPEGTISAHAVHAEDIKRLYEQT